MPPSCTVCARPDVRKVNDALLSGKSRRSVARTFDIHPSSLDRHWWNCLPDDVRQAADAGQTDGIDIFDGRALLAAMQAQMVAAARLYEELEHRLMDPDAAVDVRAVVASMREVRASIESCAKLAFTVQDRGEKPPEESRPELDDAILAALRARDIAVEAPRDVVVERGLALPPAPSQP